MERLGPLDLVVIAALLAVLMLAARLQIPVYSTHVVPVASSIAG